MIERALLGGVLVMAAGLASPVLAGEQETGAGAKPSVIFNLMTRPGVSVESRERAFNEAIKQEALAPRPSPLDEWEPQPDGSMRNKKTGISITVRNPCPPGDIEHEFALAAYNRSRSRR
ncbi:MAG TPA: hypothetical protein VIE41_08840 [Methylomirabilota bacterium]|jgi:hypothetical protein